MIKGAELVVVYFMVDADHAVVSDCACLVNPGDVKFDTNCHPQKGMSYLYIVKKCQISVLIELAYLIA